MTPGQKALIAVIILAAVVVALIRGGYRWGQTNTLGGMMADGYRVVVTGECAVGEGRYTVQVWRGSWVDVER